MDGCFSSDLSTFTLKLGGKRRRTTSCVQGPPGSRVVCSTSGEELIERRYKSTQTCFGDLSFL